MNSQRSTNRLNASTVRLRYGFILSAIFIWLMSSALAGAACVVPADLTAKLKTKPAADVHTAVGNWFADQKQFDCAAGQFALAAKIRPESSSIAYLWGLSSYSASHDSEALAPLRQAAKLDSSDIRPHLVLGAALDHMKDTTAAESEWRAALAIDANSAIALESLSQDLIDQKDYLGAATLLDKPGSGGTRSAQQSLNLGIAYAGLAKLDDAVKVLREGLNTDPDSLPVADELAMVLTLQGRDTEAFAVFDMALEKHPGDQKTQLLYLETLVIGHADKATPFAHELLAAYPNQWQVLFLNGELEAREGNFKTARELFDRSIAQNAQYASSQKALGNVLNNLGDLPGAKEHLGKAIALGDGSPEVEYDLASVLRRMGDTEEAREKLKIYQRIKDAQSGRTQAAGKAEEGDQQMAAGDAAKAAALYREALETDPNESLIMYKLAKALHKLNDIDGEKSALERTIQINPNLAEAQNEMGYLAAHGGDPAQAELYFRAAVRASSSYVAAWVNLAATLASEEKWQEAQEALDHALEVDPDNVEARQLGQAIREAHPGP